MKLFKILFVSCFFGVISPGEALLSNWVPRISSITSLIPTFIVPSWLRSTPSKPEQTSKKPLSFEDIKKLGVLPTSASATEDEIAKALVQTNIFKRNVVERRRRNTYNYNQDELTFKDIERFLDPVTSPSATKGELKKILEQMFALKQIRKKRSPNEKSLTIDEVDKWLDQVTSPSASKTQIRSMLDSVFHSNLLRSSNSRRSTGIQDEVPKKRAIRRAQLTLEQVMPHLNSVTSSSVSKGDLIEMLGGAFDSPYANKVMKRSFPNPFEFILSGFKAIFSLLQNIFNGVTTGLISIFDIIMRFLNHILSVLGLQSVTTVAPNDEDMYIDYDYSYDDYGKRRKRSLNELPNIINLVKKLSENAKGNYPQLNLDWTSVLFKVTEHLPELREKFNELLKLVSDFMLAEKPETKGNT